MSRGIIFIDKNSVELCIPSPLVTFKVEFPPTILRDMEVVDEAQLVDSLVKVIAEKKIPHPASFVIVLSPQILFSKDFPKIAATPKSQSASSNLPVTKEVPSHKVEVESIASGDKEIQLFIDKVPFENVGSTIITTQTGKKVVVANKSLYQAIKFAFTKSGFTVESVIPAILFPQLNFSTGITPVISTSVLSRNDLIHANDFLFDPTKIHKNSLGITPRNENTSDKRAYLLGGVFVFLFIVMIGLYYYMYMRPESSTGKNVSTQSKLVPTLMPPITISPTAPVVSSPSAALDTLSVQIRSTVSNRVNSSLLRSSLLSTGVKEATLIQVTSTVPRTLIVFSSDISSGEKELLLEQIKKITPVFSLLESTASSRLAEISLGTN